MQLLHPIPPGSAASHLPGRTRGRDWDAQEPLERQELNPTAARRSESFQYSGPLVFLCNTPYVFPAIKLMFISLLTALQRSLHIANAAICG